MQLAALLLTEVTLTVTAGGGGGTGAPTITTQPTAQVVTEGATASFSVVATGASPLTYEWEVNTDGSSFRAVASSGEGTGFDSASYTTQTTTTSMSSYSYRVTITNGDGTVTSAEVGLTVNEDTGGGGEIIEWWSSVDWRLAKPVGSLRTITVTNKSELDTALNNAIPGDEIVVAGGTYSGNWNLDNVQGTESNPIIITPASGANVNIISGAIQCQASISYVYIGTFNGSTGIIHVDRQRSNNSNILLGNLANNGTEVHHIYFSGIQCSDTGAAMVKIRADAHHFGFHGCK